MKLDIIRNFIIIASSIIINTSSTVIRSEGDCIKPSDELFYALQYHTSCNDHELEESCYYKCSGSTIRKYCNSIASYYNIDTQPATSETLDDYSTNVLKPTKTQTIAARRTKTFNRNLSCTCVPSPESIETIQKKFENNAERYLENCEMIGGSINTSTLECEINKVDVCKPLCYIKIFEERCEYYGMELQITLHTEDCGYEAICKNISKTAPTVDNTITTKSKSKVISTRKLIVTSSAKTLPNITSNITVPSTTSSKSLPRFFIK